MDGVVRALAPPPRADATRVIMNGRSSNSRPGCRPSRPVRAPNRDTRASTVLGTYCHSMVSLRRLR
jgi:hypothetical protein